MFRLGSGRDFGTLGATAFAIGLGVALAADPARAACNAIPAPPPTLRAAIGSVDTPFGHPQAPNLVPGGVDVRNVEVRSHSCTSTTLAGTSYVVTVIFKPTRGGPSKIVALTDAPDCSGLACDGGQSFHCVSGAEASLLVSPASNSLRFRFPDTDALLSPNGDGQTLAGPTVIAVTPSSDPLPCGLVSQRCQDQTPPHNLFACVDELFQEGSCTTTRADLDPEFPDFTALPPMTDWRAVCNKAKPTCESESRDLLLGVDVQGDALLPVNWARLLQAKPTWLVKGRTKIPPTATGSPPIRIPSAKFLKSAPPRGSKFPADPPFQPDPPDPANPAFMSFSGEIDKPESVLRFKRRLLWTHHCQGGTHAAQACHADPDCGGGSCVSRPPSYFSCDGGAEGGSHCTRHSDCPGAACVAGSTCYKRTGASTGKACNTDVDCAHDEECGLGLFEFRDRPKANAGGPFVISPADYNAEAH